MIISTSQKQIKNDISLQKYRFFVVVELCFSLIYIWPLFFTAFLFRTVDSKIGNTLSVPDDLQPRTL